MFRPVSFLLTVVVLFTQLNLAAFLPQTAAAPCGEPSKIYLPIVMAQPTILENLEEIMRADAAFPYDAIITQVFTNTVNVKPIGSRTIIRDVALSDGIKAEDLRPGYPVRLGHTVSKVTVEAYFEQFADPESVNYAGLGMKMPGKPTVAVRATASGWVITWPAVPNATRYLVYTNNTPDGDAPELLATLPATTLNYTATYNAIEEPFRYFAVQACNGLLEGDVSNWITDETPPANPAWVSDTFQADGHHLKWSHPAPSDVEEYIVFRNTSASDAGSIEVGRTNKLELIAPYTSEGDWFGVQAVDYSGLNKSAIVWTGQAYDPTPAIPGSPLAQMAELGGFVITWSAVPNVLRYEVQGAADSSGTGAAMKWQGVALTTPTLAESGVSWFRVRAVGYDESDAGWTAWMTDSNPPPQPALQVSGGELSVILSLESADPSHKAVGFSHYVLERADDSGGGGATVLDDHALFAAFPQVISQASGVIKYFRLTPYDWAGNAGTPTSWISGKPITAGASDQTIQDKFDGYGGTTITPIETLYWLSVHDMRANDASMGWWDSWFMTTPAPRSSTTLIDGDASLHLVSDAAYGNSDAAYLFKQGGAGSWDFSADNRFTDDDYVLLAVYVSNAATLTSITLSFDVATDGGLSKTLSSGFVTGWNYLKFKKSEFAPWGDPVAWSYIVNITIRAQFNTATGSPYVDVDDLRIVKAHPDDPNRTSDVGKAWEFSASTGTDTGQWHIYPGNRSGEPGKPFSLGQINQVASPTAWYLAHKPSGTVDIWKGTIQAGIQHKYNGKSGLAFYIKDATPGQWTMYAVEADNVADSVTLVKWVNGTRTVLGTGTLTPFISGNTATPVWIGADFREYDSDGGRIKVFASTTEGNLMQAASLRITVQDTELGSGGNVGLLSNQTNGRFVNFTAGSPAHAEVADVAKSLDGPIIAGPTRRVHFDLALNRFRYTDDGAAFGELSVVADANKVDKISTNRPGVTRLYRNDNDSSYNVQTFWDGSRWVLQGYVGDSTYHAPCRVAYADNAGALSGYSRYQMMGTGCTVYRSSNLALSASTWTAVSFSALYQSTDNLWNGGTRLTANRTGWHLMFAQANLDTTGNSANNGLRILIDGGSVICQVNERKTADTGNTPINLFAMRYMYNGQFIEMYALVGAAGSIDMASIPCVMGLICLETA
ncbi:MAG: hypothetical protein HS114_34885 [Anaerolineales bacterium]|nr:hypothetical protein [Anaerolineales bacterium]